MGYLLDANVFLEAKNDYYGMDFCPAFWRWLTVSHADGQVLSIVEVREELKDDVIRPWVAAQAADFFRSGGVSTVDAHKRIDAWLNKASYLDSAMLGFTGCADVHLVAYALAHGHTVVTQEKPVESMHKLKIPNACRALKVRCINTIEMLRELQARFVLGPIHEPYKGANLAKMSKEEPPRPAAADVQEALLRSLPTGTD
jgi:hypothetical protein